MFKVPECYRITTGNLGSDISDGNNGLFLFGNNRTLFYIIASDGEGWEHVSVHCVTDGKDRTPTWAEMCKIKHMFWHKEACVIQYHPCEEEYVNVHKHTLHLWRPIGIELPKPPKIMIG